MVGEALKAILLVLGLSSLAAISLGPDLLDPATQPKFTNEVFNALDPDFMFYPEDGYLEIYVELDTHYTGILAEDGETPLPTPIFGYSNGESAATWPGRTIEVYKGTPIQVRWVNKLKGQPYLLTGKDNSGKCRDNKESELAFNEFIETNTIFSFCPEIGFADFSGKSVIDSTLHWAYSLADCRYCGLDGTFHCGGPDAVADHGTPIVPHLHGHSSDPASDGNPEQFFAGECFELRGPRWKTKNLDYKNSQQAANLWYHDHTLGITRLNVYAGLAGLYFIRDEYDTGKTDNPIGLPAFPYELAFVIQDRMFKKSGELFYPGFPGDPFYEVRSRG